MQQKQEMKSLSVSNKNDTTSKGRYKMVTNNNSTPSTNKHSISGSVRDKWISSIVLLVLVIVGAILRRSNFFSDVSSTSTPSNIPMPTTWTLPPNDVIYPIIASNTASLSASQTKAMVLKSLSMGITNIDVHLGGSERDGVAEVLKLDSVSRCDLFLVTKIDKPPADMIDPLQAADLVRDTIKKEWPLLGVEYVDVLLLKDSASCDVMQAQWAVLEELLAEGKTRALGTYNYCQFSLDCILETATTPPALNYIMRHVGMGPDDNPGLASYGEARGIRTVMYGTLGEPVALEELLTNPTLKSIAQTHERSVEEVALRWNLQSGYAISNRPTADYAPDNTPYMAVCPTTTTTTSSSDSTDDDAYKGEVGDCGVALMGMRDVVQWKLSRQEMAQLDEIRLDITYSQSPTYYSSTGCPNSFGVVDHPTKSSCRGLVNDDDYVLLVRKIKLSQFLFLMNV